jgi:hypothetical protein
MNTFTAINLDIEKYIPVMLSEIIAVKEGWYFNEFRNCEIIRLHDGKNNDWNEYGFACPTLQHIVEEYVFPWMDPKGKVNVLKTQPHDPLHIHLDTKPQEIGTLQDKFRIVLKGSIQELFFIGSQKEKVSIPQHYSQYILDGAHPHGLYPHPEEKVTLCIGSPWNGKRTKEYADMLHNSTLFSMKVARPEIEKEWSEYD